MSIRLHPLTAALLLAATSTAMWHVAAAQTPAGNMALYDSVPGNVASWCQSPTDPQRVQPCRQPSASGTLTDASVAALGTTATTVLSACGTAGAGTGGVPATGCAAGDGRRYLGFSNQNNVAGTAGDLCIGFGTAPSCAPGGGSLILAPGQGWTFEGTAAPADDVRLLCSVGTCAAWVKSQ